MRVELNATQLNEIAAKKNGDKRAATAPETTGAGEGTSVSLQGSVQVGALVSQALRNPEVREDRVAALRQQIASGQYKLDAEATAAGMLSE